MSDQITKQATYQHPIEKVWEAISKADQITKWFIKADFSPEQGYKYKFTHEDTTIVGEVIEVNEPNKLTYTWHIKGMPTEPTTVTWELQEENAATKVTITHSDLSKLGEMQSKMSEEFSKGWASCLDELNKFLR